MRRRFFCKDIPDIGNEVLLSEKESRHIRVVQRDIQEDKPITLLDGTGTEALCSISSTEFSRRNGCIKGAIISRYTHCLPSVSYCLYVALPKHEKMMRIIQSSVELGVTEIFPIFSQHTIAVPKKKDQEKWREYAVESCKQSGNPFLPIIHNTQPLKMTLGDAPFGIVGTPGSGMNRTVQPAIQRYIREQSSPSISVWIGPEGGFSNEEMEILQQKNVFPVRIGEWVLRVETAVVACIVWAQQLV